MDKLTERTKILSKAYEKFCSIEKETDLRKNELTPTDYYILLDVLKQLNRVDCEGVWYISKGVANWCKKCGMLVTPPGGFGVYNSVNYWISTNTICA
jgi:hypothetical protein